MGVSRRRWTGAFAAAVLVHAGIMAMLVWQQSDPGAGAAGQGVVRVSLGRTGGESAGAAGGASRIPDAEVATVDETAASPPVDEPVPAELPATAMPVNETASVVVPARPPPPAETEAAETVAQAAASENAVPVEAVEPAVSFEASVRGEVAVAETVVDRTADEAAAVEARDTPRTFRVEDAAALAQAAPPDDSAPVGMATRTWDVEVPEPEPGGAVESATEAATPAEVSDTAQTIEAVASAEAPESPRPIEPLEAEPMARVAPPDDAAPVASAEAISASPERAATVRAPAESIEVARAAQLETAADPAPPDADAVLVERVQPVGDRPSQHLVSVAAGGSGEGAGDTAATPPASEMRNSGHPAMPAIGSGARVASAGNPTAHHAYLRQVLGRIARFKRYPRDARRDGVVGKVIVRFTVLADGTLASKELTGSSGDHRLDQAALDMLSRARPFPPIPRSAGVGKLELSLPVQFSLSRKRTRF